MATSIQEMQWVLRAQVGDREALESLLRSVLPSLRRYLTGLGGPDGEDLLQDVMVIIIRRLGSLQEPQLFRAWMYRIASREAFRHLKKRRLWIEQHDDAFPFETLTSPHLPRPNDVIPQLMAAAAVSPASGAVLLLHFQEELSLSEIAAILDIPLGTAKSRLAYGLTSIRKHLKKNGETHG